MADATEMTVDLPSEMAAEVVKAVTAGDYGSRSEVILDALRLWKENRDCFGLSAAELGALWDKGIASGSGHFASIDELLVEAGQRADRPNHARGLRSWRVLGVIRPRLRWTCSTFTPPSLRTISGPQTGLSAASMPSAL